MSCRILRFRRERERCANGVPRLSKRTVCLACHMVAGGRFFFEKNRLSTRKPATPIYQWLGTRPTSHLGLIDFRSPIYRTSHSNVDKNLLTTRHSLWRWPSESNFNRRRAEWIQRATCAWTYSGIGDGKEIYGNP